MASSQLVLNLVEGSVSFGFTAEAARDLQSAIALLMQSLKAAAQAASGGSKPTPQNQWNTAFLVMSFWKFSVTPTSGPVLLLLKF